MGKFNQPVPLRGPDTHTAEGGEGFTRTPKDELFTLGLANMVGIDTFYEKGTVRDKRFVELIAAVTKADPDWARAFIGWLRSVGNMRSAPVVAAAEYIRAGGPVGRSLVREILQRPDEPGELLGYWLNHYGRALPKPLKRGVADALPRLYNERNVLRYDGADHAIRFGDVVEMVHPSPRGGSVSDISARSALYKHLIDRRHGRAKDDELPMPGTLATDDRLQHIATDERRAHLAEAVACGWSWERLSGWLPGGMDAEAWMAIEPNMNLMALVRNLRNFDQADVSDAFVAKVTSRFLDPEEVRKSRQFPLRFLTAWKATTSVRWGLALEGALKASLSNVPRLGGRTLILVDVSPSMRDHALSTRTDGRADTAVRPFRWEVAAIFGAALARTAEHYDMALFDFNVLSRPKIGPGESVLRFVEQCGTMANSSNGTDILRALSESYDRHDRVVILTDEQQGYHQNYRAAWGWAGRSGQRFCWDDVKQVRCPVFTFNLGGFRAGVTPNERNWFTLGGLNDACFRLIPMLENRNKGIWPWDVPELEAPAEND